MLNFIKEIISFIETVLEIIMLIVSKWIVAKCGEGHCIDEIVNTALG